MKNLCHHLWLIAGIYLLLSSTVASAITIEVSAVVPGCGDSNISSFEQCDGTNMGGATCSSLGFVSGILSCSSACTFNTSLCKNTNTSGGGGGGSSGGSSAPSTNVVFSGKAYPRSTVVLLKDAQVISTTVAGEDSIFQTTISGISSGNYLFSVYAEDKDGVRSSLLTFPIGITSGMTTKVGGIYIAPTISLDKLEVKKGETISIFGQSMPSSTVTISINSEVEHFIKKRSDENGIYLAHFDTSVLENGSHVAKSKSSIDEEISSNSTAAHFFVGDRSTLSEPLTQNNIVKADLNKDNRVNLVDLSIMAYWYKKKSPPKSIDMNKDGIINLVDLSILMYRWTG